MILQSELELLAGFRMQIQMLVEMEKRYRHGIESRMRAGEPVEPGVHEIDIRAHVCDTDGVHGQET